MNKQNVTSRHSVFLFASGNSGGGALETTTAMSTTPAVVRHSFPHPWVNHPEQVSYGRLGTYPDGSNLAIGTCTGDITNRFRCVCTYFSILDPGIMFIDELLATTLY